MSQTPPRPRFHPSFRLARRLLSAAGLLAGASIATAQTLPPEVDAALARARLPRDALVALVADADGRAPPRLLHRADVAVNPASLMKLVTTFAALDQLGPAFVWNTPVYLDGPVKDGVLQGNLYIRGLGDPKLVIERLWLLLRRVQGLGVRQIAGDIVLDRSAFVVPDANPADFDGEPLRPYNAAPDALLINFKSVVMTFSPERASQSASVSYDPPLAGVTLAASVPLADGDCGDWRARLAPDFADPLRIRFAGAFPAACGEKVWPVAYADPRNYAARAVQGLWQEIGGRLGGRARDGRVPSGLRPAFELPSPVLTEVVRDVNKFSNNVMAQQLFLTLSQQAGGSGTPEASRALIGRWWRERIALPAPAPDDAPLIDNGSGLSRDERISAAALARLLQVAYNSPLMPELMSSLPLAGVDGTLRRARGAAFGQAHLKTGSLRDVTGIAGYVLGASGRRHVLVAIVNHPQSHAARPALQALLDWTLADAPRANPREATR